MMVPGMHVVSIHLVHALMECTYCALVIIIIVLLLYSLPSLCPHTFPIMFAEKWVISRFTIAWMVGLTVVQRLSVKSYHYYLEQDEIPIASRWVYNII